MDASEAGKGGGEKKAGKGKKTIMDRIKEKKQAADQQTKVKLAEMEKRKKKKADGLEATEQSLSSFILDSSGSSESMIDGSVDNVNLRINEEMSEVDGGQDRLDGSRRLSARS